MSERSAQPIHVQARIQWVPRGSHIRGQFRGHFRGFRGRGYALLVTLVMLGLMGVIVGGLARMSADAAMDAREAEDRLRRQWAERSCQRTLLGSAAERSDERYDRWVASFEEHVDGAWGDAPRPVGWESLHLSLTGVEFWVRIEDEQAKINLNQLLRTAGATGGTGDALQTKLVLRDVLGVSGTMPRVTRPELADALGLEPLESWGQAVPGSTPQSLLRLDSPEQLLGDRSIRGIAAQKTLWGSGKLNLATAPEAVLLDCFQGKANTRGQSNLRGAVQRLLAAHREDPTRSLQDLIAQATDVAEERAALGAALTTRSRCFSMWFASRSTAAVPDWSLHVTTTGSDPQEESNATFRVYRW